jgi:hypothetical protein
MVKSQVNISADQGHSPQDDFAALRTLERELSYTSNLTELPARNVKKRSRSALAAVAFAGLVAGLFVAGPLLPSLAMWRPVSLNANSPWDELSELKSSLAALESAQQTLLAELEVTRWELNEMRKNTRPAPWYTDIMVLNYRSPWPAKH